MPLYDTGFGFVFFAYLYTRNYVSFLNVAKPEPQKKIFFFYIFRYFDFFAV